MVVLVDVQVEDTPVRVNISIGERLPSRLDAVAAEHGMTRSGFIAAAVRRRLEGEPRRAVDDDTVERLRREVANIGRRVNETLGPDSEIGRTLAELDDAATDGLRRPRAPHLRLAVPPASPRRRLTPRSLPRRSARGRGRGAPGALTLDAGAPGGASCASRETPVSVEDLYAQDFGTLEALVRAHAAARPDHPALVQDGETLTYAALDARMDRIAAALQRDGVGHGGVAAACATTSIDYATAFLGTLRAGAAVAPLAPSSTPESLVGMLEDCGARRRLPRQGRVPRRWPRSPTGSRPGASRSTARTPGSRFEGWLAPEGATPARAPESRRTTRSTSSTPRAPPARPRASCSRTPCAGRRSRRGIYDADSVTDGLHPALFQHHPGQLPADAGRGRHGWC